MVTIFDCSNEMSKYHADQVTLNLEDQQEMRGRRDAGRTRLINALQADTRPAPMEWSSQGSYAMRTMHQDPQNDYDIDDGVYFAKASLVDANDVELTPLAARTMVCDALTRDERLKHPAKVKDNCVRQVYPEGYHIDMPVYRIDATANILGESVVTYDIVGELNEGQADGSQLRRIVRLTKKQARSRMSWKSQTVSGICMTKLTVDHFVAKDGRDDEALYHTWNAISSALALTQHVDHPIVGQKALAQHGDSDIKYFHERMKEALKTLAIITLDKCTRKEARQAWGEVFNTGYFGECPNGGEDSKGGGGRGPFVVTSSDVAKRDDGDRRFG
jgi:hypothetical protein